MSLFGCVLAARKLRACVYVDDILAIDKKRVVY